MHRAIKGQNCATTREVIREHVGGDAFDRMVAELPDDLRALATRRILSVEWVDFALWNKIETAFYERLFNADDEAFARASQQVGERDFGTVYRALISLASPYAILGRVPAAWSKVFNFGSLTAVTQPKPATRDNPVVLRLTGVPSNPSFVLGMRGGIQGVVGLTRAKAPLVSVLNITRAGDDSVIDYACALE